MILSTAYFSPYASAVIMLVLFLFLLIWGILSVLWRKRPDKNKPLAASIIIFVIAVIVLIGYYSMNVMNNVLFIGMLFLAVFGVQSVLWRNKKVDRNKRLFAAAKTTSSIVLFVMIGTFLAAAAFFLFLVIILNL
ncbi:hypothetical protein [Peribacillus deserti]|uniref:hypothetical protein n=1 Tax=Peribacillus deserti TaxID=673318 RepID=UPI0011581CB6|nr:hypothetical protein [Peribacillus deserti]